jgi:HAE1 family hydrophobic/amphiphilic exporter-1
MLPGYSVKKPYTVVVAVVIIAILGIVSLMNMTTDLLPSINLPYAVVVTAYIGASPEEVETVVSRPFEQAMASLSNIKNISSISQENMSILILEFAASVNMDTVFIEMRENLDMITARLPQGVGSPIMLKLNPDMMPVMVLSVAVEGAGIGQSSPFIAANILHEFESVEGVASVNVTGLVDNQVHIIVREEKIQAINARLAQMTAGMGLQLPPVALNRSMVSGILQGQNFSMPAGYITEGGIDYLVRTGDKIQDLDELNNLVVMSLPIPGIPPITLADVAEIVITDNSNTMYSKLNGSDAVILTLQKQSEHSTSDVAARVRQRMASVMDRHEGVEIVALMDQGVYIDTVVGSISTNLILGGILAVLILFLFLRDFRPTLVVGFAIPVSLVTALVMMYFSNVTLNIISMGGLALGVGMLVDNSIVVIENIYRMKSEGKSAREAAVQGAKEVSGAISASTLTTISVFLPILFTQGITRQIFMDMGLTIAFSLLASLLIALTLVPMIASNLLTKEIKKEERKLDALKAFYTKILVFSLRRKALVVAVVFVLLVGSIAGAFSVGTEFFPASDSGQLSVNIRMPQGSTLEETAHVADEVLAIIHQLEYVENVGATLGSGMGMGMGLGLRGGTDSNQRVSIYVLINDNHVNKTGEIARQIREKTAHLAAEISVEDSGREMGPMTGGGGIAINVRGRDFATLERLAVDVSGIVAAVKGTTEVSDGIDRTEPELRVTVDKEKSIAHGLTVAQVFVELNQLLRKQGSVTTISVGNIDYDVLVKDEESVKETTREDIENLVLTTPQGHQVALRDIATIEEGSGYRAIRRENQQRTLTVSAQLEDGYNIGLVSREISRKLAEINPPQGYQITMGGEQEAINSAFRDLFLMLALAVAFIYLIMVAQFQSLLSPFIVMFTLPLAFTGGFAALIVTGNPVSIVAFVGLIILTGVVVNNGIVFVDYINILRDSGLPKTEAIIRAGNVRLRPIIMTALTTIIALSTMSFGMGTGTEMIQPMAITAIGGLIYATLLTLILIPVLYDLLNRKERVVLEEVS